jgi:hypothetical protein
MIKRAKSDPAFPPVPREGGERCLVHGARHESETPRVLEKVNIRDHLR